MLSSAKDLIVKNQPAGITGIFAHTYYWITSSSGDYIYPNPSFKPSETEESLAVYCVHGTCDHSQAFSRVANRLLDTKLPEIVNSINLVAFTGRYQGNSIPYFAQQLDAKIHANQHKRVLLIGHSRGGLEVAYLAEYLAKDIKIDAVIALGSPFNGSYWARGPFSWFSTSVQQMEVSSVFLKKLRKRIMKSSIDYYFVVAGGDYIVASGLSHIPEYVEKKPDSLIKLGDYHGHLSMLSSHKLVRTIRRIIHEHCGVIENNSELESENHESTPVNKDEGFEIASNIF